MYKIYLDESPIWSPADSDKRLTSPTVTLEVNKVGSMTFTVLPGHPHYSDFVKMKSIITVTEDGDVIFKGRVYGNSEDFYGIRTIEVEGLLGYFNDSIVRTYNFSGSPGDYVRFLINQHNSQVEQSQRFKFGMCTVKDNNNYIVRSSSENPSTWSEITEKLINNLGGYIRIRYENDGNYIDYLEDFENTAQQEIAYSVNLLDLTNECKADSLATCIIPFGASNDGGEKVNIKSVNNGVDYVCDEKAVALYGRIYEVVTWDDVTLASNLLTKAKAYLNDKVRLTNKITVNAIDMHLADSNVRSFRIGDYVRVYSSPHGVDERILLTAYTMNLQSPADAKITLGLEKSSYLSDNQKGTYGISRQVSDVADSILQQTREYTNEQIENSENNTQNLLKGYVTSNDMNEYKDSVSEQFEQVASLIYPVGAVYTSRQTKEPSTMFGGTWQSCGSAIEDFHSWERIK